MFFQTFLSPQVKQWAIIIYKLGIYELPRELPNDLRLKEISRKCLNSIELWPSAQSPRQNEKFVNTSKKVPKNSD